MTKLTPAEILSLSGQALSDAVAERVMWWTRSHGRWFDGDSKFVASACLFAPHDCHNDASRVMDRIAELCLQEQFIRNLTSARGMRLISVAALFDIANARPTDICRAALMAVEGQTNG